MSKPGHVGRPVNKRQQFYDNEKNAPNNSGFSNDPDVLNWIRKPEAAKTYNTDDFNTQRNNASRYFFNDILIPERQAAFAANPITPYTDDEISQIAATMPVGQAPTYLGLSNAMTPLQQRTAIAAGALNSNDPRYKDAEALKYYQSQAFNNIRDPNQISDIDQQFIKSLGGKAPVDRSVGGFLSALFEGVRQHLAGTPDEYKPKTTGPAGSLPNYGVSQSTSGSYMSGAEGGGD